MVLWLLFILLCLYLVVLVVVARIFVYPFRIPIFLSPGFLGTPQEWAEFPDESTGKLLRGWLVPHENPQVVVVAAHGYMMNRAELSPIAARFQHLPISYLFFDFPAHGSSQGKKSGFGIKEKSAIRSAVAYARKRYPSAKIVLLGSSMGAAASAFALGDDNSLADGLVLDSCYDQLIEAVSGWWLFLGGRLLQIVLYPAPLFGMPMAGVNPFKVVVSQSLANVDRPTLLLHGRVDSLAPLAHAEANLAALKGDKKLVVFDDCNHSEARWEQPDKYFDELETFLKRFLKS